MHSNSNAPYVGFEGVGLPTQPLRGHVEKGPYEGVCQGLVQLHHTGQSEITQLDKARRGDQYVGWLQVAMDQSSVVQTLKPRQDLEGHAR